MTPAQADLVQASFRQVVPIRDQAAALFYARLFDADPSTRPMFRDADMAAQGAKLMAAIGFVVASLKRPEAMIGTVQELARRHAAYGVEEAHYATVGAALLWTLEQGLGEDFTPEVGDAWAAAYAVLSGVMIAAAKEGGE